MPYRRPLYLVVVFAVLGLASPSFCLAGIFIPVGNVQEIPDPNYLYKFTVGFMQTIPTEEIKFGDGFEIDGVQAAIVNPSTNNQPPNWGFNSSTETNGTFDLKWTFVGTVPITSSVNPIGTFSIEASALPVGITTPGQSFPLIYKSSTTNTAGPSPIQTSGSVVVTYNAIPEPSVVALAAVMGGAALITSGTRALRDKLSRRR